MSIDSSRDPQERGNVLFDLFIKVFEDCTNKDQISLKSSLGVFASWYKTSTLEEQSLYHQKVVVFMKEEQDHDS